jgi:hypothetical protein
VNLDDSGEVVVCKRASFNPLNPLIQPSLIFPVPTEFIRYSTIMGAAKIHMFIMSVVGVMIAAMMKITRINEPNTCGRVTFSAIGHHYIRTNCLSVLPQLHTCTATS